MRREYSLKITLNGRALSRVLIDPHYEIRHRGVMTDSLILALVKTLDGEERQVEAVTANGFEIMRVDPVFLDGKPYRLVLTLPPRSRKDADYIGVVNAFRVHDRNRKRKE